MFGPVATEYAEVRHVDISSLRRSRCGRWQVFLQAFEATLREQLETHSEPRPRPAPVPVSGGAGRSSIVACVPLAAPDYHSPVSPGMTLTMAAHPLTALNQGVACSSGRAISDRTTS